VMLIIMVMGMMILFFGGILILGMLLFLSLMVCFSMVNECL